MADNNKDRISKEALKAVEDFVKKTEQGKKNVEAIDEIFGNIATQMFGISGAAFFKEVPKTTKELEAQRKKVSEIKNELDKSFKDIEKSIKDKFGSALSELENGPQKFNTSAFDKEWGKSIKDVGGGFEDMNDLYDKMGKKLGENSNEFIKFKKDSEEYIKKQENYQKDNEAFYDKILENNTELFAGFSDQERKQKLIQLHQIGLNKAVSEQSDLVKDLVLHSSGFDDNVKQSALDAGSLKDRLAGATQELESANKKVFSLSKGLGDAAKNIAAGIIPKMMEYDQVVSDAGKNFGFIDMKSQSTSNNMAELGQNAARFNMSMGDAVNMMGELGDELSTIDSNYLANSVKHFTAIEKATGISSGEITTIAGEMMRAGKSAEDVEKSMEGANTTAKLFGVNTKKVLQGVAKNIDKMRTMGFQGGVESLTKMVATAERLRMNVDEIFDVAKKARTIEGAMDMAAELQLAGGSFANIDPMSLLAAARKGPEELQKILTQMGGDIGKFNEDGTFEIDAIDADRLQMVADATGQSVDSLSKMIQKNAEDNKKLDFLPDMQLGEVMGPDGKPLDQDLMNNMLLDAVDVNGKALEGGLLDEAGIGSLEDLTADQAQQLIEKKVNDQKTLAQQAEANQSFQDSITAFKDAIMNLFIVFEPFIKGLTSMVQTLNSLPGPFKFLAAALIGLVALGPKLLGGFAKFKEGASAISDSFKGFKEKGVKGIFSGATPGKDTSIPGAESKDMTPKDGKDGGGLQTLAKGLAKMGGKNVLKGIGNTALAGPALALMLLGMPTLLLMAGIGALGALVEAGFKYTASGISAMGEAKGLIKGALAMVIVGASLIPFAFALQMMSEVSWKAVGIALVMMLASVVTLTLLGALLSTPIGAFLLVGALMLVAVGVALMAFGASLLMFASAGQAMQGMEFGWLGDLGWNLLIASPGLMLGGAALMMAAPALLIGSMGLMALGVAAKALSGIDWEGFSQVGNALSSIVPGLIGFSLAGLMFANPVTLLGMLMMMGNLGMLAAIMAPLSESLNTGADGLDRFAEGLTKLQAAANSLDFERLESLKDLSMSLAVGSSGGGMGDELAKIAEAIVKISGNSGGGTGGGTKKFEVDLKINGRTLQTIILDDTEIVS